MPTAAAAVIVFQAALSFGFKPSQTLSALTLIPYFLLLAIATGAAATNAVQKTLERRTFWVFLAIGLGLWTLDQWFWVYYQVGWQIKSTDSPIGAPLLFLHVIFFLAALATRPDLGQPSRSQRQTTLDLFLILFFWTFLYAYFVFSCQFLGADSKLYNLRFDAIYFAENFALIATLAILIFRTQQPWKAVYWHMFGAASVYAVGSLAANIALDLGGYYPGHWSDFVIIISISWFVWVPLSARRLAVPSVPMRQAMATGLQTTSVLAMFAVLTIPVLGAWELYQGDSVRMQRVRLLEVLGFMLLLALAVFIKWYFEYRELKQVAILSDDMRRKSEERFGELVQSVDAIVWEADAQSLRVSFVSQGVERILGYSPGEWMETPDFWANHLHPEDRVRTLACEQEALAKGKPLSGEYRMMSADGRVVWFRDFIHPVLGADGKTERLRGIMLDITESREAEEDLRHSEDRYRDLVEHSRDLMCTHDLRGRLLSVNPEPARILGYTPAELLNTSMRDLLAPEVRGKFDEYLANVRRDGVAQGLMVVQTRKGERRFWEYSNTLRTEGVPEPVVRGMARDITARKRAEKVLRESEQRYRLLFERNQAGVSLATLDGIVDCNEALASMFGYESREDMLSQDVRNFYFDPADRRVMAEKMEKERRISGLELCCRKKDGTPVWVLFSVSLVLEERQAPMVQVTAIDITGRKRAEEALVKERHLLQTLVDNLPDVIYFKDCESRFTRINEAHAMAFGLSSPAQALGKTDFDYFADEHAQKAFADEQEIIRTGQPMLAKEEKETWPDGHVTWVSTTKMPLRDANGKITGTFGISRDITDRKRAEEALQGSRDQLRALAARLQKVREEERTRVARELHDQLGQDLTAIKIGVSSLIHALPADEKPQRESILKLADETIRTVRRISTELRPPILDDVDLVAALEWATEEFAARTGTKCQLDLPQDVIVIDPERATGFFRIFQETMTNVARHANATQVNVHLAIENGILTLEVHDNGKGIAKGQISASNSLGILGMRERVLLLGGELAISGAMGKGTTVRVRIPGARPKQQELFK